MQQIFDLNFSFCIEFLFRKQENNGILDFGVAANEQTDERLIRREDEVISDDEQLKLNY